eukprot:jgi/Botrbrau1/5400/Bobra.182_1s0004.1
MLFDNGARCTKCLMAGTFTDRPTKNANPIVESEHRERSVRFTESHSDELIGSYDCTSPFSTRSDSDPLSGLTDGSTPCVRWGAATDLGGRERMEDSYIAVPDVLERHRGVITEKSLSFFGVFDGHGGAAAAQFAQENMLELLVEQPSFPESPFQALRAAFMKADEKLYDLVKERKIEDSGSTALAALVHGTQLFVANAGDSRAVLSRRGRPVELSTDHKAVAAAEAVRIEAEGGHVTSEGYLNAHLSVARALGNFSVEGMKTRSADGQFSGPLTAVPEIKTHTLTHEDEFMVVACDGLWDVVSSARVVELARLHLQQKNDPDSCARYLVESALEKSATDNLTVIVVCFSNDPPPSRGSSSSFVRVLSKNCLETLSQALVDADADKPRQTFQRASSDFAMRVGSSLASSSVSGACPRNTSGTSAARPPIRPHDKLGDRSLLG